MTPVAAAQRAALHAAISSDPSLAERVSDHLARLLERAAGLDEPFSHFFLQGAFPDDVYVQMLRNLPPAEYYRPISKRKDKWKLPDGTSTRDCLELYGDALASLPEAQRAFWSAIATGLTSPRVQIATFHLLATDMHRRFGAARRLEDITAYPKPALMRDLGGYEITPHPDTSSKIVTMQFYLPADRSQEDFGTAFYKRRLSLAGLTNVWGRFRKVKQLPFLPNSVYAFAVTRWSWHGRELLPHTSQPRNTLMMLYYDDPNRAYT